MFQFKDVDTWYCWLPDYDQTVTDARLVRGIDPSNAALDFISRYEADNADYPVGAGGQATVAVARRTDKKPTLITVQGDPRPHYMVIKESPARSHRPKG